VEEEKRLLEEIQLSNDDVVIIASFKLPISVSRDGKGGWKIKPSRSLLYPTLYKLRDKGGSSQMIQI
jgi:hypothetical protein